MPPKKPVRKKAVVRKKPVAARKNAVAKKKARSPGAMRRAEAFFVANVGKVLGNPTLRRVIGGTADSWTRRVRELREKLGYNILTNVDRSDLKPGEYILIDLHRRPVVSAKISKKLRATVLERNGYTCQSCGIGAGEIHEDGRPARLQIGHIIDASHGGKPEMDNLRALCSLCNEGSANVAPPRRNRSQILAVLRRSRPDDQRAALAWLKKKFGE
jgi:hypothetical protein